MPRGAACFLIVAALLLAACARTVTPPADAPPRFTVLGKPAAYLLDTTDLAAAHKAFLRACPRLLQRGDASGLIQAEDWAVACADDEILPELFFERHFRVARAGSGTGHATGYYEPEIAGSRAALPGGAPIFALPDDLIEADLGAFSPQWKGQRLRGRLEGKRLAPYYSRAEIEAGALSGRQLELAWAADPVDLFFLQIQGSGRVRLPDGTALRIGYAGQNGHAYVAIGRLLRERGLLEKAGMAEIRQWLAANKAQGRALMQENPSYIFFRTLPDSLDGPIGALGVPLLAEANAAVDPAHIPLGVPVLAQLSVDGAPWRRLLVAADTGGAIKGANRIDIFWGHGTRAADMAGGLSAPVELLLLLPRAAAERLPAP